MILIKSQDPVRPIKIKYMTEEGIKVSARPILVLLVLFLNLEPKEIFAELISYDTKLFYK